MQAESSKINPPIEFFLPDDSKYDSEETLDLLEYDLVESLYEISMEQDEVITDDERWKN